MLGRVLNTHQQWLCRQLADAGYVVGRQVAVGDTAAAITQAVREGLARADLVITTGGLGPTSDDLTRDAIATLLGRPLREHAETRARLGAWFAARKRELPPSTWVQALVPAGALVLTNDHGTAPGLALEVGPGEATTGVAHAGRRWLIMLPGPPRELRPMFAGQALPLIRQRFPLASPFVCLTLRTTGIGESVVQERIAAPLQSLSDAGLEVGYCARPGEVDVRLAARGPAAEGLVGEARSKVEPLLAPHVFGSEDDSLEATVVRLLTRRGRTVAVAESCTGGRLANRLTDVPGASVVFRGGAITYSNDLKERLVGVNPETLAQHGAVSEPVARQMADGARSRFTADYALATTGIAGPSGGSPAKPVGTVYIALAGPAGTSVRHQVNTYDRDTFKNVTTQQALELLRRELLR